ncbi:MAG: 1-acyl-sn-glycerol-3-phosphate acyltransferase [Gemmatimonadetes bacterium]|nr:1-acyl-sn-glycerol-3-phosphate acyltransferase [Gemmatimonadota bacterium]
MFYLRFLVGVLAFAAAVAYGALLVLAGRERSRVARAVARVMARTVCAVARLRVRVTGAERLEAVRPSVVIGNQQSVLCNAVYAHLYAQVPDSAVIGKLVGKWDLPLATWLFRATGNFVVDPRNPMRTAVAFVNAREAILTRGTSIWIAPEGTRWKEPGRLGPFKRGAFRLAIETGVPIVPVVVSPLKPKTDLEARRVLPNDVEVLVLDPISTAGLTKKDVDALRDEAWRRMQAALTEMMRERDASAAPTPGAHPRAAHPPAAHPLAGPQPARTEAGPRAGSGAEARTAAPGSA